MKGRLKCLICSAVFTLLFIGCMSFQCFAEDYGATYPGYVSQSSASFIECQTNLGRGSIVVPKNYQYSSIGFLGNQYNLMNINSGSISGYFVLQNGTTYSVRAQGFSTFQYRNDSGYNTWYDLTVSEIYNTNVQFSDEQGTRANLIYEFSNYEIIMVSLIFFFGCALIVIGVIKRSR